MDHGFHAFAMTDGLARQARTFEAPADDFDPHEAAPAALRRHGFPRRPHPEAEPMLASLWRKTFRRPVQFVQAEFGRPRFWPPRPRPPHHPQEGGSTFGPLYWAGAVRSRLFGTDYSDFATWVYGQFTVPEVSIVDPAGYDDLVVGFWVGIDDGDEILQGGVGAVLDAGYISNDIDYYPWVEWWTSDGAHPNIPLTNFPISRGDTISVLICAGDPNEGQIYFLNHTTGMGTSVGMEAAPGFPRGGGQVEWIVEAPPQSPLLPSFNPVTFTDCSAGSPTMLLDLTGARTVEIQNSAGTPLTQSTIASPSIVVVEWTAFT